MAMQADIAAQLGESKAWPLWRYLLLIVGLSSTYIAYAMLLDLPLLAGSNESIVPLQTGFWAAIMTSCLVAFGHWTAHATEARLFRILGDLPFASGAGGIVAIADEWAAYQKESGIRSALRSALIVGTISGLLFATIAIGATINVESLLERVMFTAWYIIMLPPLFGYTGMHVYRNIIGSNFVMKRAVKLTDVDILRPERQIPFARLALRNGLVWILALTVTLLLTLGDQVSNLGMLPLIGGAIFLICLSFWGPVYLIHKRFAAEKTAELDRIAPLIVAARIAAEQQGQDAAIASTRLSGLLNWRAAVAGAKEWPTDFGTMMRLFLYLAIPLGGWVASALVEMFIDSLL